MAIDTIVTNAIANDPVTAAKFLLVQLPLTSQIVGNTTKIATAVTVGKIATSGTLPALNGSALTGIPTDLVLLNTTTISSATAKLLLLISLMMHMKLL